MLMGPNGAGKTTSAMDLLPDLLQCQEYVNADSIAAAISPFNPESTALKAGRLMLGRIHELADQKQDFAFETTGASKSFAPFLAKCKKQNYYVTVLYLWLHSTKLALNRVASRVEDGGHDIPAPVVRRRYYRGLENFFNLYVPLADEWQFYDNSASSPQIIARKKKNDDIIVTNHEIWIKANKRI
jgi:predicted ABC-type ATPase